MKLSGWMVLPLVLGLSSLTVACNVGGDREADEQLETEPAGAEPVDGDEEDEDEDEEGESDD